MESWLKITIIVAVTTIIIAIIGIVFFRMRKSIVKVGHHGYNLEDVFGKKKIKLEELLQIQEIYKMDEFDYFRTYNPCIFKLKSKSKDDLKNVYFVYRMSNFTMCEGGKSIPWTPLDMSNIESHTFIQSPSGEMFKIGHPELSKGTCIRGCEDARTIVHNEKLWITCNAASGDGCRKEMTLMEIDLNHFHIKGNPLKETLGNVLVREIIPDKITKLSIGFDKNRDQKNWMPFVLNDNLHFVYSINPHIILRYNQDGTCIKVSETENNLNRNLRGGSQIVKIKLNGKKLYMGLIHLREEHLEYVTYFYAFENAYPYKIKYITDPFVISKDERKKKVQFASGLAKIYEDGIPYFYILYGEDDCKAKLCKIPVKSCLEALRSIENQN